ncbi:MAG: OmpA family protein [Prevotella sp.]
MAAALCLLTSGAAMAQDSDKGKLRSYSFVEAQGGIQLTLTDAKMDKLITPMAALSFGHYFSPAVGARLHVSGWESKSGYNDLGFYKWNYITTNADLLVNLSNIIWPKTDHCLNLVFVGGVGLTTGWGNDDANTMAANNHGLNMPLVWDGTRLSHNIRAGLRLETDARKAFGLSLEVAANSLDDRFNSKYNNTDDWMLTAALGVSYRFGHKYCKPAAKPEPEPVLEQVEQPKPAPAPKPTTKVITRTIEKKVPVTLHEERFYKIREAEADGYKAQMERVAKFLNDYPEAKVSVTGYADKGTGNSKLNVKYAKQRADQYKKELVDKYGADANRIVTDSKGDSVQPFAENDKNRCVIVEGSAEKTVTETIQETVPISAEE